MVLLITSGPAQLTAMMRQLSATDDPTDHEPEGAAAVSRPKAPEPVLCHHCGRTASNDISCQGMCVADSGY